MDYFELTSLDMTCELALVLTLGFRIFVAMVRVLFVQADRMLDMGFEVSELKLNKLELK